MSVFPTFSFPSFYSITAPEEPTWSVHFKTHFSHTNGKRRDGTFNNLFQPSHMGKAGKLKASEISGAVLLQMKTPFSSGSC